MSQLGSTSLNSWHATIGAPGGAKAQRPERQQWLSPRPPLRSPQQPRSCPSLAHAQEGKTW